MSPKCCPRKLREIAVSDATIKTPLRKPTRGSTKGVFAALLALVLLLIVVRGSLAILGTDTNERGEEFVRGSVAAAIQGDLDLPIEGLFYHPYEGGGFVQALLTIPVFALLGPNILAHKVVAIFADALVLLAGCLLARRAFGFRALVIFGLLFVFAPMPFQKLALLNLGIHYHALVFQFLVAGLTLRLLQERRDPSAFHAATPWALGLAGGFGFFYNYQLAPLIGLAGLVLFLSRTLSVKRWGHLLGGCLIGLLPLLFMGSRVGLGVFDIHGNSIAVATASSTAGGPADTKPKSGSGARLNARQKEILAMKERRKPALSKLPRGIAEATGTRGRMQLALFTVLPLWGLLRLRKTRRKDWTLEQDSTLVLTSYILIFLGVIPFSGFMVIYFPEYFLVMRYAPFWGFATLLVSGLLASLWSSPTRSLRQLGIAFGGVTLALGIWSFAEGIAQSTQPDLSTGLHRLSDRRGTDFRAYYSKVANRVQSSRVQTLRTLVGVQGVPKEDLFEGAAEGVYRHSSMTLPEIVVELQEASPDHWQSYLPGLGAWAMKGKRAYLRSGRQAVLSGVAQLPEGEDKAEIERRILFGLGRFGSGAPLYVETLESELNKLQSGAFSPAVFHGFGHRCFSLFVLRPEAFEDFLAKRSQKTRDLVRFGFEQAAELRSIRASNSGE